MPVNFSLRTLVDGGVRAGWPPRCLACGMAGDAQADRDLCPACHSALPWLEHACRSCAEPLSRLDAGGLCGACLKRRDMPISVTRAAFVYAAPLDHLLPRFKFHQSLAAGRLLAGLMADAWRRLPAGERPDALLAVPLHGARLRQRGYDQALELARPLARALDIPLLQRGLQRQRATAAQSRLDKAARRRNLRGAFRCRPGTPWPAHVALVDDVMTTGATLEAAAWALRAAGVERVDAWVCARVA
ncbi:double zinc ribbon domain-containing protein [Luteimonas sp. e5]